MVEVWRTTCTALDYTRHRVDNRAVSGTPPGWYSDPSNVAQMRWWDGYYWTAATSPRHSAIRDFARSLPWLRWLAWLATIAVAAVTCLAKAESRATQAPQNWYLAAFCIAATLTLVGSFVTLREHRWLAVLVFAALVGVVVALAIFVTAAPATSRSCDAQYDCDTGYGLGLPFVAAVLFVPAAVLSVLGKVTAAVLRRRL